MQTGPVLARRQRPRRAPHGRHGIARDQQLRDRHGPPDRSRPEHLRQQQNQCAADDEPPRGGDKKRSARLEDGRPSPCPQRRKYTRWARCRMPPESICGRPRAHCPRADPWSSSSKKKKAGQGTDISVCALSGCRFSEQLALQRTRVLCQKEDGLSSGKMAYSMPCCLHQMSMTVSTGRSLTRRTCRRTGWPRMETLFFFLRSCMACAATSSGPYHLST